jgi:Zn-dependent peptidase ImmA (M78 family)
MSIHVDISPSMITWAIRRAGFTLEDFAARLPKVIDWINNKKKPTLKQLEDFSYKVHVPFGYLFLDTPPADQLPIPYFRTGDSDDNTVSLNLFDTILLIQRRQEWLSQYLQEGGIQPLRYVGKYNVRSSVQEIVADIRSTLGLSLNWARQFATWEEALGKLSERIEESGIVITFNSVVENNTHRPITVEECRGFVLVDAHAPFMFINAADGKAAQMFTIVHELAHIWTGKSAGFDFKQLLPANDPIEKLCDQVAAEFLVPQALFIQEWATTKDFRNLARRFKVSPIVIARRALDLKKVTRKEFFDFYNAYINQVQEKKDNQSGGGDFYVTQKRRLSLRFTALVDRAVKEDRLLYRDAYRLTGLKGDTYQNFVNKHFV